MSQTRITPPQRHVRRLCRHADVLARRTQERSGQTGMAQAETMRHSGQAQIKCVYAKHQPRITLTAEAFAALPALPKEPQRRVQRRARSADPPQKRPQLNSVRRHVPQLELSSLIGSSLLGNSSSSCDLSVRRSREQRRQRREQQKQRQLYQMLEQKQLEEIQVKLLQYQTRQLQNQLKQQQEQADSEERMNDCPVLLAPMLGASIKPPDANSYVSDSHMSSVMVTPKTSVVPGLGGAGSVSGSHAELCKSSLLANPLPHTIISRGGSGSVSTSPRDEIVEGSGDVPSLATDRLFVASRETCTLERSESEGSSCSESSLSLGLFCGLATGEMSRQHHKDFHGLLDSWSDFSPEERIVVRDVMLRDALPPKRT